MLSHISLNMTDRDKIIIRLQNIADAEAAYLEAAGWVKSGVVWKNSDGLEFDRFTAVLLQKNKDQEFVNIQSFFL